MIFPDRLWFADAESPVHGYDGLPVGVQQGGLSVHYQGSDDILPDEPLGMVLRRIAPVVTGDVQGV